MDICTNDDCGQIFATYNDMFEHMEYHCKQDANEYHNRNENGIIDRRAPYGFGVPNVDERRHGE